MRTVVVIVTLVIYQAVVGSAFSAVSNASSPFAHKLYARLARSRYSSDNLLLCPLNLDAALALVYQGAGGNTAAELEEHTGFTDKQATRETALSFLQAFKKEGDAIKVVTKLFLAANFQINQEFLGIARNYFLSDVEGVDYSVPEKAASQINRYVEDNTNYKIQDLILPEDLSEQTKMIIVNAVHFQATWKSKFSAAFDGEFKDSDGKVHKTKFINQIADVYYKHEPSMHADILILPYKENFTMFFSLPEVDYGLTDVKATFVNTDLQNILKGLKNERVNMTIPKFRLKKTLHLKEDLQSIGIKDLFNKDAADLHGIAEGEGLVVTDIIQKTFIDFHESGTDAASTAEDQVAVSASLPSPPPVQFFANRPFYFGVMYNNETLLFLGQLAKPTF